MRERKKSEEIAVEMGGVRTEEIDFFFLIFTKCTVAFQK